MEDRFIPEFLVCESPVSEVYGSEYDRIYNVRSKLFDRDFVARAYTAKLDLNVATGKIEFDVVWKDGNKREVRYPFHFLRCGVLYALKLNKHRATDAFALNHELFALEWDTCVIAHFIDDQPYLFIASREEWMASSVPGQQNEEVQVFMQAPDYRRMPKSMIPESGENWLDDCICLKRNR